MKTIARAVIFALSLAVLVWLLVQQPAIDWREALGSRLISANGILLLLVYLSGLIGAEIAFLLTATRAAGVKRVLFDVLMGGVAVAGFLATPRADEPLVGYLTALINVGEMGGLVVAGVVWLVGYLLGSLLLAPLAGGVSTPRGIAGYIQPGEQVLARVQQSRLLHPFAPDSLIATSQRLLVYRPHRMGLTSTIEDYNYVDIANVRIDNGILFSTIVLRERFEGHDMVFGQIPRASAEHFVQTVSARVQQVQKPGLVVGQAVG